MLADHKQIDYNIEGPKQKRRHLGTASNEITWELQLDCGRPTLALSSAFKLVTPTLSWLVFVEDFLAHEFINLETE